MGASQSSADDKQKNQNSLFPSSAPAPSAQSAVVGGKGKSARRSKSARKGARRSKSARKGAKRSARRSARRSSKRGMKGGSSCMKMSGGKHRRSRSRSRGRGRR